jgi:hypothetical protein
MSTPNPTGFGMHAQDELNDLRMSDKAVPLLEHVKRFVRRNGQPDVREILRSSAKAAPTAGATPPASWNCSTGQGRSQAKACGTSSCPTPKPAKA